MPAPPPQLPERAVEGISRQRSLRNHEKDYLVIVDAFSSYPEVIPLSSQSSNAVINEMKATFARHAIPDIVHSDNGHVIAVKSADFNNKWRLKHITSSPHFPSFNGLVEKAVQTVKNIITKSIENGTDPFLGLLAYRSTPIIDNHKTRAVWLMGRKIKTDLPIVENQLKAKDSKAVVAWKMTKKEVQKAYHD